LYLLVKMPEKIDESVLEKVAKNARLRLSKKEIDKFLPELEEILNTFSKIDEIEVEKEKPSFQPVEIENVFREDKEEPCLKQKDALSNTKHKKEGFFLGPKVV